jgi:pentatricopeptide repeat protein
MMLRPALPCSPVIFLSIDYERYMTMLALRGCVEWRFVGRMFSLWREMRSTSGLIEMKMKV